MAIGTQGNDTLSSSGSLDFVLGLGGNDVLTSIGHNSVLIDGGSGQDQVDHTISDPGNLNLQFLQLGDSGADTLTSDIDLGYLSTLVGTTGYINAGSGNDLISTDIASGRVDLVVIGDTGDDEITLDLQEDPAGWEADFDVSVYGGSGADTITTTLSGYTHSGDPTMNTTIEGGYGADVITVHVDAYSNFIGPIHTVVKGGGGHDSISAVTGTSSNVAGDPGFHDLSGDFGNDTISSTLSTGGADIDGGTGNDVISSVFNGYGEYSVQAENVIVGGSGHDVVDAVINGNSANSDGFFSAYNDIDGGFGHDTLKGSIDIQITGQGTSLNDIRGGAGDDVISGKVLGFGSNLLNGEGGSDLITSVGGSSSNYLIGGFGEDTLIGGSGEDNLDGGGDVDRLEASGTGLNSEIWDGGAGADVFAFHPTSQQDDVTIINWERDVDILEFTGLVDSSPQGLADDLINATVADGGLLGDVVLTLSGGTKITFVGEGTLGNTIISVDLIVDDALAQIIA